VPLAVTLSAGNRHDVTQLLPLIDLRRDAPIAGKVGRPRGKTDRVLADRGYDYDKYRRHLRARGIVPVIAKRCTENGSGLGRERWVVERVRHEALLNREEVRGLFLWAVAAAR
jgi:IS5 family transposase